MNKLVQLFLVAVISSSIGIGITYWILDSNQPAHPVHGKNIKHESGLTYTKEAMPGKDYAVGEHGEIQTRDTGEKRDGVEAQKETPGAIDYFKLSQQLKKFTTMIDEESHKKYETVSLAEKINEVKDHYLTSKMNAFRSTKTNWFTATIPEEGSNKIVLYFNYYPCTQGLKKIATKDSCFMVKFFSFYNEKWYQYSISSTVSYFSWKEDAPYLGLSLAETGAFADENKILKVYFPIPDENGKMTFLKYVNSKFVWEDDGEVQWTSTNEKEERAFEKSVNDHSIARGDRLGQ